VLRVGECGAGFGSECAAGGFVVCVFVGVGECRELNSCPVQNNSSVHKCVSPYI